MSAEDSEEFDLGTLDFDQLSECSPAPASDIVACGERHNVSHWQLPSAHLNEAMSLESNFTVDTVQPATSDLFQFVQHSTVDGVASPCMPVEMDLEGLPWGDMNISRPILRAINDVLKFQRATPIQRDVIPIALEGRDVMGCAKTGSGKSAAFLIPIIERIISSSSIGRVRAVVLLPTRELAIQCWSMFRSLSTYTKVTSLLVIGGFDASEQNHEICAKNPDVLIATPGRLLDHILNSRGVDVDSVDIVVLDEADRLLEMGFKESINEILESFPSRRNRRGGCQTMLFSATMPAGVKELSSNVLGHDAVVVKVDEPTRVVSSLVQEFLKVPSDEMRQCAFFSLLETITEEREGRRVIVFFREKRELETVLVSAELFGLSVVGISGNMTQPDRLSSIGQFQAGTKPFLFATDVAARGLDLPDVGLVINYNIPHHHKEGGDAESKYIHRVGRTARMGRMGKAITLYTGDEYASVKRIIKKCIPKATRESLCERKVSKGRLLAWSTRLGAVRDDVEKRLTGMKIDREISIANMQAKKLENMEKHKSDIGRRPLKQWIKRPSKPEHPRKKMKI